MACFKSSHIFHTSRGMPINANLFVEYDDKHCNNWRIYRLLWQNKIIGSMNLIIDYLENDPFILVEILQNHTVDDGEYKIKEIGRFLIMEAFKYSIERGFGGKLYVISKFESYNFYKYLGFTAQQIINRECLFLFLTDDIICRWFRMLFYPHKL
jgi:hypothetical protein